MVHEQSSCTHTSFACGGRISTCIVYFEVTGDKSSYIYRHNGGGSRCVSLVLQCHIWLEYIAFGRQGICIIYSHDAVYRLSIATLSLKACLVLVG